MPDQLSKLFLEAVDISNWEERQAFVDEKCAEDDELAAELLQMLRVHHKASGFLSQPPSVTSPTELIPSPIGRDSVLNRLTQEFDLKPQPDHEAASSTGDLSNSNTSDLTPRYQLHGEIARGGMGAIVKAKDVDLGRTLAVKVLLDEHRDNPAIAERFIEEAQIGGQLQHPGITPVYELGATPDNRPFFSMKLVKGQTLAALLKDRKELSDQRSRLLGIFEQVCQTTAYAHSRRVIHRDLKPANIMVGAFGEVQVMDWGLAKVLKTGGIADEKRARDTKLGQSLIQTVRSGSSNQAAVGTRKGVGSAGSETHAGSVMGTPAYMPPEQALGEVERLDERCDVFGLGAILCEILTGAPPYVSEDQSELFRQAARGKLDECHQRLDVCGADQRLIEISKACLEPEIEDRLRNARELSDQITEYLESVESRLREAEVERAAETARVVESRKRRKVVSALAASILLILTLAGSGAIWFQVQESERRQAATTQLAEFVNRAKLHQGLAESENLATRSNEISKALASIELALGLFENGELGEDQRDAVIKLERELQQTAKDTETQLAQQKENHRIRDRLEFMRLAVADDNQDLSFGGDFQARTSSEGKEHADLFRELGIDIAKLTVAAAADRLKTSQLSEELIAGIDQWTATISEPNDGELLTAARATGEWQIGIEKQQQLISADEEEGNFVVPNFMSLATLLILSDQQEAYRELCQRIVFEKPLPGDHLESERITKTCLLLPANKNSIEYKDLPSKQFVDALDKHTEMPTLAQYTWGSRGLLAYRQERYEECLEYLAEAERLNPVTLAAVPVAAVKAMALHEMGNTHEAKESFAKVESLMEEVRESSHQRRYNDALVAFILYRESRQLLFPESPALGFAEWATLDPVENELALIKRYQFRNKLVAIANQADSDAWRCSVRNALVSGNSSELSRLAASQDLKSVRPELVAWFAASLRQMQKLEEAKRILEVGYASSPDDFWINYEMGRCLTRRAESQEAIGFARAAVALRPESAGASWSLAIALADAGQTEESDSVFESLLADLEPDLEMLGKIASDLHGGGHFEKEKRVLNLWLGKAPNDAEPHARMAAIYQKQRQLELSLEWAEKALQLDKENLTASFSKAFALSGLERDEEAAVEYQRYTQLNPSYGGGFNNLGRALQEIGRTDQAEKAFREAMRLHPGYSLPIINLRNLIQKKKRTPAVWRELRQLSAQLAQAEQSTMRIQRDVLRQNPRDTRTRLQLVQSLRKAGDISGAIEQAELAVSFDPDSASAHFSLALLYRRQGQLDKAIEHGRKAVEIGNGNPALRLALAQNLTRKATGIDQRGFLVGVDPFLNIELNPEQEAQIDEAIAHLERGIELSEARGGYTSLLTSLLRLRGRESEAVAVEGQSLERLKNLTEQIRASGKQIAPPSALSKDRQELRRVSRLRAQVAKIVGQKNSLDAIEAIKEYLEQHPEDADPVPLLLQLAKLYNESDQPAEARAVYSKLLALSPGQAHLGLARLHREQGEYGEAEQHYSLGIESDAKVGGNSAKPSLQFELADLYVQRDKESDAIGIYETILEANAEPQSVLLATQRKYEIDGDLVAAKEQNEKWQFDGDYPPFLDLCAWLWIVEPGDEDTYSNLEQALGYVRSDSRGRLAPPKPLRPSSVMQHYRTKPESNWLFSRKNTLGMVHFRRREYQQALLALQEFHEMGFEEPSNWLFLAMTHWKLGNEEEARNWLKKATDYLDRDGYSVRHSEKLFRAEAEKLVGGNTR